jgi:hypothetical protein
MQRRGHALLRQGPYASSRPGTPLRTPGGAPVITGRTPDVERANDELESLGRELLAAAKMEEDGGVGGGDAVKDDADGAKAQRGKYPRVKNKTFADRMKALAEYTSWECRLFESYIAALSRRRRRVRGAKERKRRLDLGLFDEGEEEEDAEDRIIDPQDYMQLLMPANNKNLHYSGRHQALWAAPEEFDATAFLRQLSPKHLEEILVDDMHVGKLFRFGYQPFGLKSARGAQSAPEPPQHGEFFEREALERLLATNIHERHVTSQTLQCFCRRLCAARLLEATQKEFKAQDDGIVLAQASQFLRMPLRVQAILRRILQGNPYADVCGRMRTYADVC